MSLRIEPLNRRHDRTAFTCGDETVDQFLRQKAMQDQDLDLGRTCVLVDGGADSLKILGYHTLAIQQIPQDEIPDKRPKIKRGIPVILIGQLGVDLTCQGEGYGELLLEDAQARVLEISKIVGVRSIVLDARNERLVTWYSSHGFLRLDDSLRMAKRTEVVRRELAF